MVVTGIINGLEGCDWNQEWRRVVTGIWSQRWIGGL